MERQWNRALIVTLIMILSTMAGCLDNTDDITDEPVPIVIIEDSNNTTTPMPFGNVMVSTYHVGELVSAVAGEHVTIEYMSQDNIPVHDYEPTVEDIIRLQNSDLFFYHGLNLEPWVESTLSSLGDDAPPSFMTHAMSTGQITLDYESLLVSNLCEVMNEGPFEATTLGMMPEDHHEDHDDHDDHNETGDHDGHNETGDHDEHDEHEGHEHAAVEKTISDPEACPADTNIHIFHMEEGEHVLEFESEHDESFNMVALKMLGGHAHHHHHDHGDHGAEAFEWAGVFAMNDATHTWSMQKVGGDYADQTMRLVLIPTDTPTEENMHELEAGVEALIEGDSCTIVEDGETMSSIAATGSCFELHVGTGDDSTFTMDTTGITGMAMYAQHVPTEFERDQHYLKDSAGNDIEPIAQEGAGAHDHGDHGDEHDDEMCHNTETHANYESTEEECEAAGHQWMGDESHGDDHGDEMCHNTETHMNYNSTEEDCEAAGHHWMGHDDHNLPEIHAERIVHTFSFPEEMVCYDISTHTLNMTLTTESDCQAAGLMWTAANSGPSDDDHDEHNETGEHGDHGEEEHHEVGAAVIHIEAEGDYGFALPKDVELYVLMGEGGHDDHDDHGDHGAEAFEWAGVFAMNDATHTWSMQKVGGDYADQTMRLVLIPTDTPTEENMHELEAGVEALIEGDSCTIVEDGETMSSIAATGSCFELHVGTGDDSTFTMDTTGITGMAMYAQHVPTEFERDQHYLKDSAGNDIEPIAQEGAGAHDHGDHGDETEGEINADDDQDFKYDPHSWLDPLSFAAQVDVVLEKLILTFPNGTSNFTENANSYKAQLQTLDNDFVAAFGDSGTCSVGDHDKTIVANHNAYSYMSERYDIEIVTVNGLDPEGEPSAQDIVNVINHIKENEITVLFVEEYTNENAVNSIVEDTGVSIEKLYTMEMAPIDTNDNYLSLMNKNLNNLVNGIGC